VNILLDLIIVAGWVILVWYFRSFVVETTEYKHARRTEIKRRLQVEHKQEEALKHQLSQPLDDNDKLKLEIRAAHERHQRAVHYVIEDVFERYR
jgi:hypothetical protein